MTELPNQKDFDTLRFHPVPILISMPYIDVAQFMGRSRRELPPLTRESEAERWFDNHKLPTTITANFLRTKNAPEGVVTALRTMARKELHRNMPVNNPASGCWDIGNIFHEAIEADTELPQDQKSKLQITQTDDGKTMNWIVPVTNVFELVVNSGGGVGWRLNPVNQRTDELFKELPQLFRIQDEEIPTSSDRRHLPYLPLEELAYATARYANTEELAMQYLDIVNHMRRLGPLMYMVRPVTDISNNGIDSGFSTLTIKTQSDEPVSPLELTFGIGLHHGSRLVNLAGQQPHISPADYQLAGKIRQATRELAGTSR